MIEALACSETASVKLEHTIVAAVPVRVGVGLSGETVTMPGQPGDKGGAPGSKNKMYVT